MKNALRLLELTREEREAIHQKATGYANQTIRFAEPESPRTEDVIVQAFRIGDQAIVSMPFEVLVEIGVRSKKRAPPRAPSSSSCPTAATGTSLPRTRSSWADTRPGWERPSSKSSRPRCW